MAEGVLEEMWVRGGDLGTDAGEEIYLTHKSPDQVGRAKSGFRGEVGAEP